MSQTQIIEAIKILVEVIKSHQPNSMQDDKVIQAAKEKLHYLIGLLGFTSK